MDDFPDITLAVKALLLADEAVAAAVNNQVFCERLPQTKSKQMILLWVVVETPFVALDKGIGMDQALIQINAYGDNPQEARRIAWLLNKALDGKTGVVDGVHIKGAHRFSGVATAQDQVKGGTDIYRFIAIQDYRFTYNSCEKVSASNGAVV